jgi:hypothetical protein
MFDITAEDIIKVGSTYLSSKDPLEIAMWPSKEKRRYILITLVASLFEKDRIYDEKDVTAVIAPVWHDHVTVRRYLVDYRFLARTADGSRYWVPEHKDLS